MSIFARIKDRIFGAKTSKPAAGGSAPGAGTSTTAAPTASAPNVQTPASATQAPDVEAILNELAGKNPQKLNWRTSIVDLMKLLDLDSSLENRKELAKELGYTGSTSDTATMNIWLHKQVMRRLAENGGKVPNDLKD